MRLSRRQLLASVGVVVALAAGAAWWAQAPGFDSAAIAGTAASEGSGATGEPSPSPGPAAPSAAPSPAPSPPPSAAGDAVIAEIPDQQAVPVREIVELPPIPLTETADFGNQVAARVVSAERIDGVGQGVGELSGPSMLLSIDIANASADDVDLDYLVVNLFGADGAPGQSLWGDERSEPLFGRLPPGESRTGTFVLRLPDDAARSVTVTVSYGAATPTAVFTGEVAT